MSMLDAFSSFGIAGVIAGLIMFTGSSVLLVISILKTVKGKKLIGGIIVGGIMALAGIIMVIVFGSYVIMAGMMNSTPYAGTLESYGSDILSALYDKNDNYLAHLFAKESYSGDALAKEDAEIIFGYIDGDVENIRAEAISSTFKNDTYAMMEKYTVITEDADKYDIYICFIYGSDNKDYMGIQYIKMCEGSGMLEEFGEVPDLD